VNRSELVNYLKKNGVKIAGNKVKKRDLTTVAGFDVKGKKVEGLLLLLPGASKEVNNALKVLENLVKENIDGIDSRMKAEMKKEGKAGEFKEYRKQLRHLFVDFAESLLKKAT
jgi:hypothetical protein